MVFSLKVNCNRLFSPEGIVTPTAILIIIGNEILSGRTHDLNIPYVARELDLRGIQLLEVRIVPDVEDHICETVNWARKKATYVFTTGGIGPTHDDITPQSVAKAFGVALVENQEARQALEAHYPPEKLNAGRLKMAQMPVGAELIHNPCGGGPTFSMENVYVLAGVPKIMQAMFDSIKDSLTPGDPVYTNSVNCDIPEGDVAEALSVIQDNHTAVEIGSYPYYKEGRFGTVLVLRSKDEKAMLAASHDVDDLIAKRKKA